MSEWRVNTAYRGQFATRSDAVLRSLAADQHGVVARSQLLGAGLSVQTVDRLTAGGRLVLMHRGVYAVGHAQLRPQGFRLAAVLACGAGARLSHRSAIAAKGLRYDDRQRIDVTVPVGSACGRTLPGLIVHRARLAESDCDEVDGIPVTSVARTLVDLAGSGPRRLVARAVDAALVHRVYDQRAVDEILRRKPALRGVAVLRSVLEERHPDSHRTRSEMEVIALEKLAPSGLRRPRVNAWLADLCVEVDLLWEGERLAVELDSRRYPAPRTREDAARGALLESFGYRVLRFGWGDITAGPFVAEVSRSLVECRKAAA
ncbi:MAG: type IV toxin-antitoxin system AbiEi family antitoxin domain-containing protein [Solirubrobacteraceae bacterium]